MKLEMILRIESLSLINDETVFQIFILFECETQMGRNYFL
jgi:hypothetical protein